MLLVSCSFEFPFSHPGSGFKCVLLGQAGRALQSSTHWWVATHATLRSLSRHSSRQKRSTQMRTERDLPYRSLQHPPRHCGNTDVSPVRPASARCSTQKKSDGYVASLVGNLPGSVSLSGPSYGPRRNPYARNWTASIYQHRRLCRPGRRAPPGRPSGWTTAGLRPVL